MEITKWLIFEKKITCLMYEQKNIYMEDAKNQGGINKYYEQWFKNVVRKLEETLT